MKSITLSTQQHLLQQLTIALFSLLFFTVPLFTSAATSKPSCELTVTTDHGSVEVDDREKVSLPKGEALTISWTSKNTKKAFDDDGKKIELDGMATSTPEKSATYTYRFENGNRKVECEVAVQVVSGSFNETSLASMSSKTTLSGKVSGSKSVQVEVYKKGADKPIFTSKKTKVKNGKWTAKITRSLSKGEYDVVLVGDTKSELNTIATDTLSIGTESRRMSSNTTFVAESVPLLRGGTAGRGAIVPISYVQLINIGKATGTVESFTIKQNGSASTDTVLGFLLSDNRTSAVSIALPKAGVPFFKDGMATIQVDASIAPGKMQLFTIKAILAPYSATQYGKQLKLDIAKVVTDGEERGTFPIRGTTWTLGF